MRLKRAIAIAGIGALLVAYMTYRAATPGPTVNARIADEVLMVDAAGVPKFLRY